MENRMSIREAAALMGASEQFVRVGLQRNQLPFGFAVKNKTRWCYFISRQKFEEMTGIKPGDMSN